MKVLGAAALLGGVAAGYFGAKQLLEREELPEQIPEPLRRRVLDLRARLQLARVRAQAVIEEADRERQAAEAELLRDYYERVGRPEQAPPPSPPPRP